MIVTPENITEMGEIIAEYYLETNERLKDEKDYKATIEIIRSEEWLEITFFEPDLCRWRMRIIVG